MNMPGGKVFGGILSIRDKRLEFESEVPLETLQEEKSVKRKLGLLDGDLLLRWGQRKRSRIAKGSAVESTDEPNKAKTVDRTEARVRKELLSMQWQPAVESIAVGSEDYGQYKRAIEPRLPNRNAEDSIGSENLSPQRNCVAEASAPSPIDLSDHSPQEKPEKISDQSGSLACNQTTNKNGIGRRRTELESLHTEPVMLGKLNLDFFRWPKILVSLSHKEKEDDFLAIKGSKLPQRPRRRAKHVEKSLLYVSPGTWLCELTRDRYEVREKKSLRKKPRGLKVMGSDSE